MAIYGCQIWSMVAQQYTAECRQTHDSAGDILSNSMWIFSARCNINYTSGPYDDVSVRLSDGNALWSRTVHAGKRGGVISRYASHC